MAQALTHKRNTRTDLKPAIKNILIVDWDSYLYQLWKQHMVLNPGLYDDACISHISGLCKCGCTRAFVLEVRKKKK